MKRTYTEAVNLWTNMQTKTTPELHSRRTKINRILSTTTTATPKHTDKWASSSDDDDDAKDTASNRRKTKTHSYSSNSSSNSSSNATIATDAKSVDNYKQLKALGEGQYGTVWMAQHRQTGDLFALKQIKLTPEISGTEGFPSTALREINVLQSLDHRNIIRVHEVVVGATMDKIFIVMDYVPVELGTLMVSMGDTPFSVPDSKCLISQLLDGLVFMHEKLLVHRDVKPTNILYHGDGPKHGTLVLCDFGLAKRISKPLLPEVDEPLTPLVVTLFYRAIEILLGDGIYDEAVDIWSVGCVFAELVLNHVLMPGKGEIDQLSKIFATIGAPTTEEIILLSKYANGDNMNWTEMKKHTSQLPDLLHMVGPEGIDFVKGMLCYDPSKRLQASAAREHVFLHTGVTKLRDMPKVISS
jgi:serine/threonine protein kinase